MMGYFCVILLLMCGLIQFTTQMHFPTTTIPKGTCKFGPKTLGVGYHTARPCMRMICRPDGKIVMVACPRRTCPYGQTLITFTREDNSQPFPVCCQLPVCRYLDPDDY
ncbi:uncharacterized protein LOC105199455 [Solenopsis invicta]|uniref:uncharacterized protein LOC105199455 n=1 Tax=Solenopsis invicta TaxID=13686 RepID=UPI000E33DBDB|nr:uncharacterized protein LOC105199455 [Solenopsis invicta]